MAERYPGDEAAANGFGRRFLHPEEARMLYEAGYPTPPDMRVPGEWRLSAGGVPVPPPPEGADRVYAIQDVLAGLSEEQAADTRWDPANSVFWTAYFQKRHRRELEDTNNNGPVSGRKNAGGRKQW